MAAHIDSVAASDIQKLDKVYFLSAIQQGDLVFCSGQADISKAIEKETASPFSHVLMAWRPAWAKQWLTLEATDDKGVHVGLLSDYVDKYDGDLVLTRRAPLTSAMIIDELNAGMALLDDGYDWQTEITFAAHKLIPLLPVAKPDKRLYCSGLQQVMSKVTPYPIQNPGPIETTPEQAWCDPSVTPICVLLKGVR